MSDAPHAVLVLDGRVPGPRAHSITTMRTADALLVAGWSVEVWVPRRTGRTEREPRGASAARVWYGLERDVPLRALACIDGVDLLPHALQPATARLLGWTFARSVVRAARRLDRRRPLLVRDARTITSLARARIPFVAEVHELPRRPSARRRVLAALRAARGLVTLTRAAGDVLVREGNLAQHPRLVLPCGCPESWIERPVAGTASEHDARPLRVVYAGSLQVWKGADLISTLARRFPDVAFHVLGGLPRERGRFARTVPPNVVMRGFLPPADVGGELAAADVVLVTLDPDDERACTFTSPLKVVEALAMGRAVLAPELPSIRELVQHDETGWLVPAGDARAAENGLARLLADPFLRARLGRAARERASVLTYAERARRLGAFLAQTWPCEGREPTADCDADPGLPNPRRTRS